MSPPKGTIAHVLPLTTQLALAVQAVLTRSHVSQTAYISMSHTARNSIVDRTSDIRSVFQRASQSIMTASINKISHSISISTGNANQHADPSNKTPTRQNIRTRQRVTVRNSVRACFSPAPSHTHTLSDTHPVSNAHTRSHMLPKSQTRSLFTTVESFSPTRRE